MTNIEHPVAALIAGRLREAGGSPRPVENPATGLVVAEVRDATSVDLDRAVMAARTAGQDWARTACEARAGVLESVAVSIAAREDELAGVLVVEAGKPVLQARAEARGCAAYFRYAAALLRTLTDEIRYTGDPSEMLITRRRPHGVVGAIIPWNFPAALVARKMAPAVAAGNGVVLKPDEKTPLSALLLAEVIAESELPAGLVSVLPGGRDVGRQLVQSPYTDLITMTGSVRAGQSILAEAAKRTLPVSLELGGKAPFVVLADADPVVAARAAATSRHMNAGQICIAAERIYVEDALYDDFVEAYVREVDSLVLGDPALESTTLGPKISAEELDKTLADVLGAVDGGARVVRGGGRVQDPPFAGGHWMQPTVLVDVQDQAPILFDETFGPVTPICRFAGWDDVVDRVNNSRYGLSAYVYTNDLGRAHDAIERFDFGEVYVNRIGPEEVNGYHTGYRDSGLGGDDGPHGLDGYFRRQTAYLSPRAR